MGSSPRNMPKNPPTALRWGEQPGSLWRCARCELMGFPGNSLVDVSSSFSDLSIPHSVPHLDVFLMILLVTRRFSPDSAVDVFPFSCYCRMGWREQLKPEDTTFYNTRISTVKKSLEPAQCLKPPPGLGSEVLVSGGEDIDFWCHWSCGFLSMNMQSSLFRRG